MKLLCIVLLSWIENSLLAIYGRELKWPPYVYPICWIFFAMLNAALVNKVFPEDL